MSDNIWNQNHLRNVAGVFRRARRDRADCIETVRERIRTGYYLTDTVARAVAVKMLIHAVGSEPPSAA